MITKYGVVSFDATKEDGVIHIDGISYQGDLSQPFKKILEEIIEEHMSKCGVTLNFPLKVGK